MDGRSSSDDFDLTCTNPPVNPDIDWGDYQGLTGRLLDRSTGEYLTIDSSDHERRLLAFHHWRAPDEYLCTYRVQLNGGDYQVRADMPVRVWAITDGARPLHRPEMIERGISLQRFSEFLASWPRLRGKSIDRFHVYFEPLAPDGRL